MVASSSLSRLPSLATTALAATVGSDVPARGRPRKRAQKGPHMTGALNSQEPASQGAGKDMTSETPCTRGDLVTRRRREGTE